MDQAERVRDIERAQGMHDAIMRAIETSDGWGNTRVVTTAFGASIAVVVSKLDGDPGLAYASMMAALSSAVRASLRDILADKGER